jgi:hypothetical protein
MGFKQPIPPFWNIPNAKSPMTDRLQPQFTEVLTLIKTAQSRVIATTNQELIQLYWSMTSGRS